MPQRRAAGHESAALTHMRPRLFLRRSEAAGKSSTRTMAETSEGQSWTAAAIAAMPSR